MSFIGMIAHTVNVPISIYVAVLLIISDRDDKFIEFKDFVSPF